MTTLDQVVGIYTYPPFNSKAQNEQLCRQVMEDKSVYRAVSDSMRVILAEPPTTKSHIQEIKDSLKFRIPVYFGEVESDMFREKELKRVCGYTSAQGQAKILPQHRYVVCGRVLATSGGDPTYAYVAHAWGVNLESTETWDYAHCIQDGRINRKRYAELQSNMCKMIVRAGVHALNDSCADSCDLLVPMIGMGAFMTAFDHKADRTWAFNHLVQTLFDASKSAHPGLKVTFYGDERSHALVKSHQHAHFRLIENDKRLFIDAGKLLAAAEAGQGCVCVVNSWDPISFIGNGMVNDQSFDGMIGSGLGAGAQFANSCFTHNTSLMPCVLEPARWLSVDDEEEEEEEEHEHEEEEKKEPNRMMTLQLDDGRFLAPCPVKGLPARFRVDGVEGGVTAGHDAYEWTVNVDGHILDQAGNAWDVYEEDADAVDYVLLWRRATSSANQLFDVRKSSIRFQEDRGVWVDGKGMARFTTTASKMSTITAAHAQSVAVAASSSAAAAAASAKYPDCAHLVGTRRAKCFLDKQEAAAASSSAAAASSAKYPDCAHLVGIRRAKCFLDKQEAAAASSSPDEPQGRPSRKRTRSPSPEPPAAAAAAAVPARPASKRAKSPSPKPAAAASSSKSLKKTLVPAHWKTVPDVLPCSLFYLSKNQAPVLARYPELATLVPHLPCWVSHALIAETIYGSDELVTTTEQARGRPWVWAPEMNNVHQTWIVQEPAIVVDEVSYPGGPEVFFQLAKYKGTPAFAKAMRALKPESSDYIDGMKAWEVGQRWDARADWPGVRAKVMKRGVAVKFTQFAAFRELLKSTGEHDLVQLKDGDAYWGTGADGRGANMLGELLASIRADLVD